MAEQVWKWTLRLGGLIGAVFVTIAYEGNVPAGWYALAGSMMGFPSVVDAMKGGGG